MTAPSLEEVGGQPGGDAVRRFLAVSFNDDGTLSSSSHASDRLGLTPTAVKTGSYAASAGDFVPVDTTGGSLTVTLPNAPTDGSVVCVKLVAPTTIVANATVACAGSDVFNRAGGSTSATLSLLAQAILVQYKASSGIWYVIADDLPLTQLDTRYPRTTIASVARGDRLYYDTVTSTWKNLAADVTSAKVYGAVGDAIYVTALGINALNSATINVNSSPITAGFATSGTAYLAGVAFTYTGLTSSSFTGCGNHAATAGGELVQYIGTDNTTAITAAISAAVTGTVTFPQGYYRTTVAASTLAGPFVGPGQVITTESGPAYNARGKIFNSVTAQPSNPSVVTGSYSPFLYGALATAFNGDLAHNAFAVEHRISGANTIGSVAQTVGVTVNGINAVNSATINVNFSPVTAGFATSGTAYLTGVAFTYTGITSTSFTGCGNHAVTAGGETIKSSSASYFEMPEAMPFIGYLNNDSGRSGAGSIGRTGTAFFHIRQYQSSTSGGDMAAYWTDGVMAGGAAIGVTTATGVNAVSAGTPSVFNVASTANFPAAPAGFYVTVSGTTHFVAYSSINSATQFGGCTTTAGSFSTAGTEVVTCRWDQNPSVGVVAGALVAQGNAGYLDADELTLNSGVYDVTAAGMIRNLTRNNNTGALGAWWNGIRLNSNGSTAVDVGLLFTGALAGGFNYGIDLSNATINTSAVSLAQEMKVHFNASGTAAAAYLGMYGGPSSPGSDYIYGHTNAGNNFINTVVGGNSTLQVSAAAVTVAGNFGFSGAATTAFAMGTRKITGLGLATASTDAASLANSLSDFAVPSADVAWNAKKITGLALATASTDAASLANSLSAFAVPSANLAMNTKKLTGLAAGSAAGDSVRYEQIVDPLAVASGYINWNFNPQTVTNTQTLTAGTVYLTGMWLPPGQVITNVVVNASIAAGGTAPTSFFVGIAKPDGTMLAQSSDVKASVTGVQGPIALPVSYTTSASDSPTGFYQIVILQVGSWGSTQPAFARGSNLVGMTVALGGNARPFVTGATTGRTALPANAATQAGGITGASSIAFFVGVS